ncbi:iron complex outermembrane receptor protein [Janthinobacterium sp. 35]|uniref:TonB-dependent receptor n=1 Tax=Janthinobacterium sp. 35 TaxID=2035210 RepID=UPI000C18FCD0|nr:TonB-dependent receptor [Janthinobacterium sp. 35]PIG27207.1 iron complex outermembrane receptor protein [Janthinobacterium sp. 35]
MQFIQQPKLRLSMIAVACQLACFSISTAHAQTADEATKVVITAKKTGMGLMVTEDAPKARSTITAEELEKQRPTGNAFEALEMLPSVNSYNYDSTGLFGGGLTLRGFNSDQIGATINGVPVNDSGSFSVYPQEYVDQENTCSEFVTQGSTDVDSPQVGATGGNFGINTCNPEDKQRVRVMQTLGQLNLSKTFLRVDSGLLSDKRSKFFLSASHAQADKWKGKGGAKRDHIDAGFNYDWDRFNYIHATLLYNEAVNNNINSISLSDINKNGYYYDFSTKFPGHLTPVKGTVQDESKIAPSPQYYKLATNPFKNAVLSATAKFRLGENTDLKILPYFWYGYGSGGVQQRAMTESKGFLDSKSGKLTGAVDLNGDGDTLDTVIMANSSFTRTTRPGVTSSLTHTIGDHQILGGFWWERADHGQTGPMVPVNNDGSPVDYYLQKDQVTRADGSTFQSRNWKTISTAYQFFLQDTINLMDDRLILNVGVRTPFVDRDFTNYANEGTNSGVTYNIKRKYKDILPQLGARFRVTADDQLYASIAKNMKAPPNFVFATTGSNVTFVNGVATLTSDVKAETSWNIDIGYRHQDKNFIGTFNVYSVDFRDRQATAYDPLTAVSTLTNVGNVKNRGFEVELGNTPINGWAFYGSFGYAKSEIKNDLRASATSTLPTKGNEYPLTPKLKAGLSAEYQLGAFYARVKAKATGKQQATLNNDETVPGYTVMGFDAGYTFANMGWLKRPKITLNISNLTDKQYRNPSSQNVTNATAVNGTSAKTVYYYLGAPRFSSVTFSGDF